MVMTQIAISGPSVGSIPDLLFLMETKQKFEYISGLRKRLGYNHVITVEPVGLSGGLAVMWKDSYLVHTKKRKDSYQVVVLSSDKRIIDLKVTCGAS